MKVTINWLKDYIDIDITPYELAEKLVRAGFEVEEIIDLSSNIQNVVVGKILSSEKHPDADRLKVCTVDIGDDKPLQIVCGAPNANVGIRIPVALVGAKLPDGTLIKKSKIRGIESYGMMCGGSELGLDNNDYQGAENDQLLELETNNRIGQDINEVLGFNDFVLDIDVTANRSDCNSIIGIAREISAVLNISMKNIPTHYNTNDTNINEYLSVDVQDYELCPRYMAKVVQGIRVTESPSYIKRRLKAVGLRPINNIVDITNYVLIEIGQPMHAFDIRDISGNQIIVRRAKENELFVALDNNKYNLNNNHLVIADKSKPIALGGVMGGENSCVKEDTVTIVFESAKFNRENIRRTSRELNIRSDSSARFEKGIDYKSQELALDRALTLLGMGEVVKGTIDNINDSIVEKEIMYEAMDISNILGIEISQDDIIRILNSLSINTSVYGNKLRSIVPVEREDIVGVNDLAEEVIRLYGYDYIDSSHYPSRGGKTFKQTIVDRIKNLLVAESMYEIMTYSFTTPKSFDKLMLSVDNPKRNAIKLMNPLGEDLSIMRTNLAHSMLSVISSNIAKGNKKGRLFEIARVYIPKSLPLENLPDERNNLVLGAFGKQEDFYSLKGIVENLYEMANISVSFERANIEYLHPGKSADIIYNSKKIGYIGEVHPDVINNYSIKEKVIIAELDVDVIKDNYIKVKEFENIPKYPSIERDLALVVDIGQEVGKLIEYIASFDMLIKSVELFDIYQGDQIQIGKKSVALNIVLRDNNKTLTVDETNPIFEKLIKSLNNKFNAKLRV